MENTNKTECKMKLLCKLPKGLSTNGNLNENWGKVRQSFDIFLKVTNNIIKSDEVKVAILLNIIGKDGIELYNKFNLQEAEKNNLARVLQCFEEHCNPKKNTVHETFKFFSRIQQEGEKFESFLTDIKKLSQLCDFGTMTNRMIRDKIVFGIRDKALQDRLLKMEDLNLQKAINYCRAAEIQERNLQRGKTEKCDVRKKVTRKSNKVRVKKATQKSNCSICNTKHGPRKCSASGKKDKECSKLNYLPEEEEEDDERIPVRRWIRKHYTKLTTNKAKCNHCFEVFSYKYVPELPCHLRLVHPDKLTEKEKEDRKISWIWDYFTPGNNTSAICNICNKTYKIVSTTRCLNLHLKRVHREIAAKFADDMSNDTNRDTTTKKVESQEDVAASSNNLDENIEETECSLSEEIIARQTDMNNDTRKSVIIIKREPEKDSTASSENTEGTRVFKESPPSTSRSTEQMDKMDCST